ncbi:TonB-dependent receptor [Flavobacteriaceae bacterium F08102]|nr:TonB-dependent receptor [Flavobacteriaceae bacterium F08102]
MKNIFIAFLMLASGSLSAQTIRGKVLNQQQKPLEGVAVINQRSGEHSHTDHLGMFTLRNAKVTDKISFSSLGYEFQEITVKETQFNTLITVELQEQSISLDQITLITRQNILSQITNVDLSLTPVKSSQEILQKVPGLIIGQHAGGGKAEQLFIRGFDVDHGTDVAISVEGMPVNMVSHAHGQGYADLHFVIPETIEKVNFGKGPYYFDQGNFTTAGYVDLRLQKTLEQNLISLELGQFDTKRLVAMLSLSSTENSNSYIATELSLTDGPFDTSQNFNRINLMGRYNAALPNNQELTLTLSHFQSKWDASGQIPQRLVDNGNIGRFGAVDDTEGGTTSRSNLWINHRQYLKDNAFLKTKAYVTKYAFELFSNFTFFLEDPVNGDQIHQRENRFLAGLESQYSKNGKGLGESTWFSYDTGIGFRYDQTKDSELSNTLHRKTTLQNRSLGDIDEINLYGFLNGELKAGTWKFNPSLRIDYFKFDYLNKIPDTYQNSSTSKVAFSPKFNAIFTPNQHWQLFLKSGIGFHSNDTRVIIANQIEDILPKAIGIDLGFIVKPTSHLVLNGALWSLKLDQEFVYVGDAGIFEPSGKTTRIGAELSARYQALDWLYLYSDINYTHGRSTGASDGEDFIPLAPKLTSAGGISFENLGNFYGGISYRYVGNRPATEDNSIIADGYFISDFNINYSWKQWNLGIIIENVFNTEWKETQFATTSRLFDEPAPIEEIHFTPGTPFAIRAKLSINF